MENRPGSAMIMALDSESPAIRNRGHHRDGFFGRYAAVRLVELFVFFSEAVAQVLELELALFLGSICTGERVNWDWYELSTVPAHINGDKFSCLNQAVNIRRLN